MSTNEKAPAPGSGLREAVEALAREWAKEAAEADRAQMECHRLGRHREGTEHEVRDRVLTRNAAALRAAFAAHPEAPPAPPAETTCAECHHGGDVHTDLGCVGDGMGCDCHGWSPSPPAETAPACPKCGHSSTSHGAWACWVLGCECYWHVAPSGEWCETTTPLPEHRCAPAAPEVDLAAHVLHFVGLMDGVELRFDMHARLFELGRHAKRVRALTPAVPGATPEKE